jgi:hypothetical protein
VTAIVVALALIFILLCAIYGELQRQTEAMEHTAQLIKVALFTGDDDPQPPAPLIPLRQDGSGAWHPPASS